MKAAVGAFLLLVATFMFAGALVSDADLGSVEGVIATLLVVGLPAAAGGWLLYSRYRADPAADSRRERLRLETMESEVVRLAGGKDGKLTVVEVVAALGLPPGEAQSVLDSLVRRHLADIHLTDSGLIVYDFADVRRLSEKPHSRGMLED